MCAALDALGANAPWSEYMIGFYRTTKNDNTIYGEEADRDVALAWLRGRLRLAPATPEIGDAQLSSNVILDVSQSNIGDDPGKDWNLADPINRIRFAKWVEDRELSASEVIRIVEDTRGLKMSFNLFPFSRILVSSI